MPYAKRCKIEGCHEVLVAKGLCGTHYMRQRRHSSTEVVEKPGPKANALKVQMKKDMRKTGEKWSERTFQRFWTAFWTLIEKGGARQTQKMMAHCTAPSGKLNVSKFEGFARYGAFTRGTDDDDDDEV